MDIQAIITMAKERLLEDGEHPPILFAENEDGGVSMFYFADLPDTTSGRQMALFGLGREHAIASPGNPLAHLYFACEMWTSHEAIGKKPKYNAPSEDPNRKEVLAIQTLDVTVQKMELYKSEILRAGGTIDLAPVEAMGECENALLPAFFAGTVSAKMSDRELAEMMIKHKL